MAEKPDKEEEGERSEEDGESEFRPTVATSPDEKFKAPNGGGGSGGGTDDESDSDDASSGIDDGSGSDGGSSGIGPGGGDHFEPPGGGGSDDSRSGGGDSGSPPGSPPGIGRPKKGGSDDDDSTDDSKGRSNDGTPDGSRDGGSDGSTGGNGPIGEPPEIPIDEGELTIPEPPYEIPSSTVSDFDWPPALDEKWIDVLNFSPPPSVRRAVAEHGGEIQSVTDAQTPQVNIDRYEVRLSDFENHRTQTAIFDHVRREFGELFEPSDATFADYGELRSGDLSEWKEGSPHEALQVFELESFSAAMLNSLVKSMTPDLPTSLSQTDLDTNVNEATVVGTKTGEFEWTFSTLTTPEYGAHPVSGNRRFRLETAGDEYTFVIEAVDRMFSKWVHGLSSLDPEVDVPFMDWFPEFVTDTYQAGHDTWVSFCENLVEEVERYDGSAHVESKFSNRFDWESVEEEFYRN